jgi:D-glycero-alpha-D-manno-heptose-7-phosphate kinase
MIITRSPFRISFAGGGTDIPYFYEKYGGAVVSTTINKYVYLSMHPLIFDGNYFLKYSQLERPDKVGDIKHNFIREIFAEYDIQNVDFNASADIPSGTGLSSSSAFAAALIQLCCSYKQIYITKEQIAEKAFKLERKYSPAIGKQDQYATAFGGLNYIEFEQDGEVVVEKLYIPKDGYDRLQQNLLLFYTGITHDSSTILSQQKRDVQHNDDKEKTLFIMSGLAKELKTSLLKNDIDAIGEILHINWDLKRSLNSGISNSDIDKIYEAARTAGASGGKLLGAGGGGFMLFYVKEQYHQAVRQALSNLQELRFSFERVGTSTVYYT